jgi:uncharacterized protein YuzB (UPF0349 family)
MNSICEFCGDEIEAEDDYLTDNEGEVYHEECYHDLYAQCPHCKEEVRKDDMQPIYDYDGKDYCDTCADEYNELTDRVKDELLSELRDMVNERFEATETY